MFRKIQFYELKNKIFEAKFNVDLPKLAKAVGVTDRKKFGALREVALEFAL
jgi:hypothetical protein